MGRPGMAVVGSGVLVCLLFGAAALGAGAATRSGSPAPSQATAARVEGVRALPTRARSLLRHRLPDARRGTVQLATNWSGEVQLSSDTTSVAGSWTVPALVPSTPVRFAATWVGIGGFSGPTLIQTGTAEVTATGEVGYSAWVEVLPTPSWTVTLPTTPGGSSSFVVAPGDTMAASVTESAPDLWQVTISDLTAKWTYRNSFAYSVSADSAEWITERPTLLTTTQHTTVLATLADYGSTTFTHLAVASGGASSAPTHLTPIRMVDTGSVISAPGPVSWASSATGVSFTDSYLTVPERIYGQSADATAAAELEHQFTYEAGDCPGSPTAGRPVVLATDATFPDALASAYLAGVLGTGTLLTAPGSLPPATLAAIRDEGITDVYVVGGPLAVSTAVVTQLTHTPAYSCGGAAPLPATASVHVTRIAGPTAYDTAFDLATWSGTAPGSLDLSGAYGVVNAAGGDGAYNVTAGTASTSAPSGALRTAILATGKGFQDAESASTLAYADHLPVLLTTPSSLSPQALAAFEDLGVRQVLLMGGPDAVSDAVSAALESHGLSVLRVAGADGTQTAIELARCELAPATSDQGVGWKGTGALTVARGDFYSDGLAGAVVAADGPGAGAPEPLVLTASPTSAGSYLLGFLQAAGTAGIGGSKVRGLTILGGPGAVTQTLANTMEVALLG